MHLLHRQVARLVAVAWAVLFAALSACPAPRAPEMAPAPVAVQSSADDQATSHHSFENVAQWIKVFDDPARDEWQKPQALVEALHIRPGMRVADLGAGTGYFSRYLAVAVGKQGTVFAVDTEPNLVAHLRSRAEQENTPNVIPILASPDNPRLPAASIDMVMVVDTYHHIDGRRDYFRRLQPCLARDGRVAIVDWQQRDLPIGPPASHKLAREKVVEEMAAAGYALVGEPTVLPYQYFLIFQPR